MQFGEVTVDPDAWTGSGTVVGTHTHTAPIVFADGGKITNEIDQESTLEVQTTEVVISKGLRVIGQLVAPGFPPPGGDMSLPTDPTFNSVVCTDTLIARHCSGQLSKLFSGPDSKIWICARS